MTTKRILLLVLSIVLAGVGYWLWTTNQAPADVTLQSGGEVSIMFIIGIVANITGVISGVHYIWQMIAG